MTINNNNIFGVFTLNEARGSRLTGDWLNKESVANYGWFGGGTPGPLATVERIDFSNDTGTISPRGSLSTARWLTAATGNSNYGWFGGGSQPATTFSKVDRIDFSNDSSTTSVRGPLSSERNGMGATGNSNYGWFGGGFQLSTVERIDFSNDSSTASQRGPLSLARYRFGGATGNSNYGWFGGGSNFPSVYSRVDRIDFSNDVSTASPRGSLSLTRYGIGATGNSNYGWFGGGQSAPATSIHHSIVDRIDFTNDLVTASVRGPLSSTRYHAAATGNSNYGWWGGGGRFPSVPSPALSTVDRINFANDSVAASPRNLLTSSRYGGGAVSGVLNIRRQKAGNFGWFVNGDSASGGTYYSTVDRIDFSNDNATALVRSPSSSSASMQSAAVGNSNYGFFLQSLSPASLIRIDFSNDSTTGSVRSSLLSTRGSTGATGNSNYGWFGGGYFGSAFSAVERIDFSNDLSGFITKASLSQRKLDPSATGNSNYGWFGGGYVVIPGSPFPSTFTTSRVDRIDFSNDNAPVSVRGPLTITATDLRSVSNSNYGWFVQTGDNHNTTRVNFSNDLVQSTPRGQLFPVNINDIGVTGNSNYGWFGGGEYPGPGLTAQVERLNFNNDTATLLQRGPLSIQRRNIAARSNTQIG